MHQQKIKTFFFLFIFFTSHLVFSQQWGDYTYYSVKNSNAAYLIDTNSTVYHTWSGLSPTTAYSSYVLPGGDLIRTVNHSGNSFSGGGMSGEFQKVDYNGNLLWDFAYSTSAYCSHHDICAMPNGNVLLIAYESKTSAEVTQAGSSSTISMWPDKIVEIQQTGLNTGTVVWEWHLWDHLCQSYNSAKDNYVTNTSDHPELFNINFNPVKEIWHANGLDYNPMLDQIVVSAHNANEVYIIDHSTTTAEAASHSGGLGGRGGDFLYRWGKPATYGQSGTAIFNVVHDAHWIPEESVNGGRIVGFNNNGISSTVTSVDQIVTPVDGYNYSYTPNTAYSPSTYTSRLACTGHTNNEGNSFQMPNGNQLVCIAFSGLIYEVDPAGNTIWSVSIPGVVSQAFRYSDCYVNNPPLAIPAITQNGPDLTSSVAAGYQWYLNGVKIPGETNQNFTPVQDGVYLVRVTDSNACGYAYSTNFIFTLTNNISVNNPVEQKFSLYPNPVSGILSINEQFYTGDNFKVMITDAVGKTILTTKNRKSLDLSSYENGMYHISLQTESGLRYTQKIILIK